METVNGSKKLSKILVLILPMRNGNTAISNDLLRKASVLILPMRNGNL